MPGGFDNEFPADHKLTLSAYVVLQEAEAGKDNAAQQLGSATVSLTSLAAELTENRPVVSNLTFTRRKGEDEFTVGKISLEIRVAPRDTALAAAPGFKGAHSGSWIIVGARAAYGLPKREDGSAPSAQLVCSVQTQQVAPPSPSPTRSSPTIPSHAAGSADEIPITTVLGSAKTAIAGTGSEPRWNEVLTLPFANAPAAGSNAFVDNSNALLCFEVMDVDDRNGKGNEVLVRCEVPLHHIVPFQSYPLLLECQNLRAPREDSETVAEAAAADTEAAVTEPAAAGSDATVFSILALTISTRDERAQWEHVVELSNHELKLDKLEPNLGLGVALARSSPSNDGGDDGGGSANVGAPADAIELTAVCELVVQHQVKNKVAMLRRAGCPQPHGPFALCRAQRIGDRINIDFSELQRNRQDCATLQSYRKTTLAANCRPPAPATVSWAETSAFPLGAGFHHVFMAGALSYPECLRGSGENDEPVLLVELYSSRSGAGSGSSSAAPPTSATSATATDPVAGLSLVGYAVLDLVSSMREDGEAAPVEAPVFGFVESSASSALAGADAESASAGEEASAVARGTPTPTGDAGARYSTPIQIGTFSTTLRIFAAARSAQAQLDAGAPFVEEASSIALQMDVSAHDLPSHESVDPELISRTEWEPAGVGNSPLGAGGTRDAGGRGGDYQPHEEATLKLRVQMLVDELTQKQTAIEELSGEVNRHSRALRTCGDEIVQLRRQKHAVEGERDRLLQRIKATREQEARDLEALELGQPLRPESPEHTLQQLRLACGQLNKLRTEHRNLAKQFGASATVLEEFAGLKTSHAELEKAHTIQAAYIQKLQSSQGKIAAYKATITMQEKVIAKLEELVQKKMKEPGGGGGGVAGGGGGAAGGGGGGSGGDGGGGGGASSEALEAKNQKIKILEEQMIANTKESARVISALKLRVFELEMG